MIMLCIGLRASRFDIQSEKVCGREAHLDVKPTLLFGSAFTRGPNSEGDFFVVNATREIG